MKTTELVLVVVLCGAAAFGATVWLPGGADNNWNTAANWSAGVPDATQWAHLTNTTASSYTVTVDSEAPLATNLTISGTGAFTPTLNVSARMTFTNAWFDFSQGAVVNVGEGGAIEYNGAGTTTSSADKTINLSDGAELRVTGGLCNFTNFTGRFRVKSNTSLTSKIAITSGVFRCAWLNTSAGIDLESGGCIEVTGSMFEPVFNYGASIYQNSGTLELGPTGTVTAANIILSNSFDTVKSETHVTTLRYLFDERGCGTMTATGKLTIAPDAKLEVNTRAYNGSETRFKLISCAEREGAFDEENVTVYGNAHIVQDYDANVWLHRTPGTIILIQ